MTRKLVPPFLHLRKNGWMSARIRVPPISSQARGFSTAPDDPPLLFHRVLRDEVPTPGAQGASIAGTAPPPQQHLHRIVILPGLLGSNENWLPPGKLLLRGLIERYSRAAPFGQLHGIDRSAGAPVNAVELTAVTAVELILVDKRNHGRSFHSDDHNLDVMADDVEQLLKTYEINNKTTTTTTSIIGHSLGGKVAMHLALRRGSQHASCSAPSPPFHRLCVVDIAPISYRPGYHDCLFQRLLAMPVKHLQNRKEADAWLRENSRSSLPEVVEHLRHSPLSSPPNPNGQKRIAFAHTHSGWADSIEANDYDNEEAVWMSKQVEFVSADLADPGPAGSGFRAFLLKNLEVGKEGKLGWRPNLEVLSRATGVTAGWPWRWSDADAGVADPMESTYDGVGWVRRRSGESTEKAGGERVLFLRGGASEYINTTPHFPAGVDEIQKFFPGAEVRTVEGAGHWLHASHPDQVVPILADFLVGGQSGGGGEEGGI